MPVDHSNSNIDVAILLNCILIWHAGNFVTLDDNCNLLVGSCIVHAGQC